MKLLPGISPPAVTLRAPGDSARLTGPDAANWSCAPGSWSSGYKGGREALIVTEIPYQVNKALLIQNIAELVRDKKVQGITDLRDESDQSGMRIVMELRKGRSAPGDHQPAL